jgi:adenine deaminase
LAVRMLTLAPAEYWRIPLRGAVAAGQLADLVLWDSLEHANAQIVWRSGRVVAKNGQLLAPVPEFTFPPKALSSVYLPLKVALAASPKSQPIIGVHPSQIRTEKLPPLGFDRTHPDSTNPDLNLVKSALVKLALVERHSGQGKTGVGFAKGIGLKRGAIAQSIAHDAHNIICAGVTDADMEQAIRHLETIQGGVVVVADGQVLAVLELPVAGLMSDAPAAEVVQKQRHLESVMQGLGCTLPHPIITLAFLALTVIPSLKITERGLFDVDEFKLLGL